MSTSGEKHLHLACFITGHGFGHAIRSATIINCFNAETTVSILSSVPDTFFSRELSRSYTLLNYKLDCGCLQSDFVTVDQQRTLEAYAAIAVENEKNILQIAEWCKTNHVDGIVSDIVPCAFEIAQTAGIPSVAVTNFTWYDIYSDYVAAFPEFDRYLQKMRQQYGLAGRVIKLMPALPMRYFKSAENVELIGRRGKERKKELLDSFGLEHHKKTAVVYIGEFGIHGTPWNRLADFSDWEFFGLQAVDEAPDNYHIFDPVRYSYPDMIASADCIFGKLGYGLVAEAMINGTPVVYLPREHFAEFPYLEKAVLEWGGGVRMPEEQFVALEWTDALRNAATIHPLKQPPVGAPNCARLIETYISLNLEKKHR